MSYQPNGVPSNTNRNPSVTNRYKNWFGKYQREQRLTKKNPDRNMTTSYVDPTTVRTTTIWEQPQTEEFETSTINNKLRWY